MNIKTLTVVIFLLLILQSLIFNLQSASASEFSAGVNPTILEIEAVSPANVKAPITLENLSDQTITYSIFLRPFKAGSELNGEPNYDPNLADEYAPFFSTVQVFDETGPITEVSLAPGEKKELIIRISVGNETEPRDYYFTIVFLSKAEASEPVSTQVNLRGGIGTNVLLSVGTIQQPEGRIASFSVPRFVNQGPVDFSLELANHSENYESSKGNVIIKNMFGQPIASLNFEATNILAGSNRLIKLSWDQKYPIGIYKADVSVALSDRGPLLKESRLFVAIPIKAAIIAIVIICIGAWLAASVRRKAKEG